MRLFMVFLLAVIGCVARAASPGFGDFLASQFDTNNLKIALKDGANGFVTTNGTFMGAVGIGGVPAPTIAALTLAGDGETLGLGMGTGFSGGPTRFNLFQDGNDTVLRYGDATANTKFIMRVGSFTGNQNFFTVTGSGGVGIGALNTNPPAGGLGVRAGITADNAVLTNAFQLKLNPSAGYMLIGDATGTATWGTNVSQGNFTNLSVNGVPVSGGAQAFTNDAGVIHETSAATQLLVTNLLNIDTSSGSVIAGAYAGTNASADLSYAVLAGYETGMNSSNSLYSVVGLGIDALRNADVFADYSVFIGERAGADGVSSAAQYAVAIGASTLDGFQGTDMRQSTFIGSQAGMQMTASSGASALAAGYQALYQNSGDFDRAVVLGAFAASGNTGNITDSFVMGYQTAAANSGTLDRAILFGNAAGSGNTNDLTLSTLIGANTSATGTNAAAIGAMAASVGNNQMAFGNALNSYTFPGTNGAVFSGVLTNSALTASTLVKAGADKALASIANAAGLLTNDGSGGFGFSTNIVQDITFNNTQIFNVAKGGHLIMTNQADLQGEAYIIIGGDQRGRTNGDNLLSTYTTATSKTPHGSALSADNRYTIFLVPGLYDLGTGQLSMSAEFIDIVGLSDNTGDLVYKTSNRSYGDTVITSSGTNIIALTMAGNGDATIANVALKSTCATASSTALVASGNFLSGLKVINVHIGGEGAANPFYATRPGVNYAGQWQDVRAWRKNAFGNSGGVGGVTLSGSFIRCKAAGASFGAASGGQNMILSGLFVDCECEGNSFGSGGTGAHTLSGKFFNIRYVASAGEASGGGILGAGDSATRTCSGLFVNCSAVDGSLGMGNSFGDTVTGTIINCEADAWAGALSGSGTVQNFAVAGRIVNRSGSGTSTFKVGGSHKTTIVQVGNIGSGEDTLMTNSIAGSTLISNGDYLEFRASGSFAANGNNKTVKAYWGTNLIFNTTALALNAGDWVMTGAIVRSNATTQLANVSWVSGNATLATAATNSATVATLTSAQALYLTGEATSNDDITQKSFLVRWYPAN